MYQRDMLSHWAAMNKKNCVQSKAFLFETWPYLNWHKVMCSLLIVCYSLSLNWLSYTVHQAANLWFARAADMNHTTPFPFWEARCEYCTIVSKQLMVIQPWFILYEVCSHEWCVSHSQQSYRDRSNWISGWNWDPISQNFISQQLNNIVSFQNKKRKDEFHFNASWWPEEQKLWL